MEEPSERPNRRYYATVRGTWTASFEFDVVDWKLFWARPIGLLDRLRVIGMVTSRAVLGRPRVDTRVDFDGDASEVRHELRISKWGVPFFHSREKFELHDDGRGLTITGEQRSAPLMLPKDLGENTGDVDASGTQARYCMELMGGPVEVRTRLVDGGADVEMDSGWGRGVQRLRAPGRAR